MHCQYCGAALESLPVSCPFCGSQPVLGDRYEIRAIIGRGGMGEVFLAHDRRLDNPVAIKRLTPQLASSYELRESLRREAQIMARLSDASIVRLFDLAEFFGDFYLILEYVPGPTLRDMIRAGYRPPPSELAKIVSEVCQGLTAAHNAGVIHRDLKPSNLLLALQGPEQAAYVKDKQLPASLANAKIKITDFGIAKAIAESHLTLTNAFSGTPGYMAPEQFRGEIPSPETDVYALGAVTYELLTGTLPSHPVGSIASVHPAVTDVIRKAMSPARSDRYASAAAYYEGLYRAIEGRSPLPPPLIPADPVTSSIKWRLIAVNVAFALVAARITLVILNHNTSYSASSPKINLPKKTAAELPPPIDWRPFPKVSELPPVVEDARGKLASADLLGPQHPKIKWEVTLPDFRGEVAAVGKDGTVYLTNQGEICAVRDGKLVWAYKNAQFGTDIEDLQIDRDGRVWFVIHAMTEYEHYCLNREGQGGRLPRSFENQGPKYVDPKPYSCWKNKHTLSGPEGDLDLEDQCQHVAVGREGRIYVATDLPQILAVSKQGKIEFKYKPTCEPAALIPTLANQLAYRCPDNTFHGMTGATEVWNRTAAGEIAYAKADNEGTIFYGDAAKGAGHLHAIDAQGKDRWTIAMANAPDGAITFGSGRRMFVFQMLHTFNSANRLLCLSD